MMPSEVSAFENAGTDMDRVKIKDIDDAYTERNENADNMLGALMDEQARMTEWEYDFVDSLVDWRSEPDKKSITFNQYETVLKLHQKYCNVQE